MPVARSAVHLHGYDSNAWGLLLVVVLLGLLANYDSLRLTRVVEDLRGLVDDYNFGSVNRAGLLWSIAILNLLPDAASSLGYLDGGRVSGFSLLLLLLPRWGLRLLLLLRRRRLWLLRWSLLPGLRFWLLLLALPWLRIRLGLHLRLLTPWRCYRLLRLLLWLRWLLLRPRSLRWLRLWLDLLRWSSGRRLPTLVLRPTWYLRFLPLLR